MAIKIAIIGAGPAGCMLGRLLFISGKDIKITIFESEASIDYRSQGGTLDLRAGSGLDAIKAAGLWEPFSKLARYDGEALKLTDKNFLMYLKLNGATSEHNFARPEIDRPELRRLLFESLPADCVQWGHKLKSVDEQMNLHFTDKPSQGGYDLIVGADGAWSKVRSRLTDIKPQYSGVSGYGMTIPNPKQDHKELYDLVNRGSIFAYSDQKFLGVQQMGDDTLSVGVWTARPEDWQQTADHDVRDSAAVRAAMKQEFADWDPKLVAYTQAATDSVTPRNLYMLPVGNKWQHVPGVTLIGDAAHLATPFAGQGVNIALQDSLKLSQAIITAVSAEKVNLNQTIDEFEKDMFKRGELMQSITKNNLDFMVLNKDAPKAGIEKFILGAMEDELGWVTWLLSPIVYTYFFWFKLLYCRK